MLRIAYITSCSVLSSIYVNFRGGIVSESTTGSFQVDLALFLLYIVDFNCQSTDSIAT